MDLDDDELKATRELYEKKREQRLEKTKEKLKKQINEEFEDKEIIKLIFEHLLDKS